MQRIDDIRTLKATSKEIQKDRIELLASVESNHPSDYLNQSVLLMFSFCQMPSTFIEK